MGFWERVTPKEREVARQGLMGLAGEDLPWIVRRGQLTCLVGFRWNDSSHS